MVSAQKFFRYSVAVLACVVVWFSSHLRDMALTEGTNPPPSPRVDPSPSPPPRTPAPREVVGFLLPAATGPSLQAPYTTWKCVASTLSVNSGSINTSCLFENMYYINGRFTVYATKEMVKNNFLPEKVSIGSVQEILYPHCTFIVTDHLPSSAEMFAYEEKQILYISPIVPWNFAHTLFSDLFPAFWLMRMFGTITTDSLVLCSDFFRKVFPLPNKNTAWKMLSTVPPNYKAYHLDPLAKKAGGVRLRRILMGSGGKGWAHFHPSYRSPGSSDLWWEFRLHMFHTNRMAPPPETSGRSLNVLICHKKDKRRILNDEYLARWIRENYPQAHVQVAEFTEKSAVQQLSIFANTTVFICNEGTSATYFFLMPRGSAFLSIAQFYGPMYRPDAKKRTGGSVDWFAPAIDWVRTSYYENIELSECVRDINVVIHNKNAEYSVNIVPNKFAPLFAGAADFVTSGKLVSDVDGYSTAGRLCKALFTANPWETIEPLHRRTCGFPVSYFCEFVANSPPRERTKHYKYGLGCYKGSIGADPR